MFKTFALMATTLALAAFVRTELVGARPTQAIQPSNAPIPSHAVRIKRERPVVPVVGYNPSTEVTDYVVPSGIPAESGVAEGGTHGPGAHLPH